MSVQMIRKVIRTDGTEEPLLTSHINPRALIGAHTLDSVRLKHLGRPLWVMLVDDTGMVDGKPVNPKATALYHANCRPGTVHAIHGDVVIQLDGDYA